jgi:hypothetical protein
VIASEFGCLASTHTHTHTHTHTISAAYAAVAKACRICRWAAILSAAISTAHHPRGPLCTGSRRLTAGYYAMRRTAHGLEPCGLEEQQLRRGCSRRAASSSRRVRVALRIRRVAGRSTPDERPACVPRAGATAAPPPDGQDQAMTKASKGPWMLVWGRQAGRQGQLAGRQAGKANGRLPLGKPSISRDSLPVGLRGQRHLKAAREPQVGGP